MMYLARNDFKEVTINMFKELKEISTQRMNRCGTSVRNKNYKNEPDGNPSVEKKNDYMKKKLYYTSSYELKRLEMVEQSVHLNMDQ